MKDDTMGDIFGSEDPAVKDGTFRRVGEPTVQEITRRPLSCKESRFNYCCPDRAFHIVGVEVEGEMPPWTPVRLWLMEGGRVVEATLEQWRGGLNPNLLWRERQDVTVLVGGLAKSVQLMLVPAEASDPFDHGIAEKVSGIQTGGSCSIEAFGVVADCIRALEAMKGDAG